MQLIAGPLPGTTPQLRLPAPRCVCRQSPLVVKANRCRQRVQVVAQAGWAPPSVADTKKAFLAKYNKPIPGIYSSVVNELIVQQHLIRYNIKYEYDEVFALGFVSVYDQIAEGLPEGLRAPIFEAYIEALEEDPKKYRQDAAALEAWAQGLSGPADVAPDAAGTLGQQVLAKVAQRTEAGKFCYSKFFAIGLFRLLELTGAKDPKALGALVTAVGVRQDAVNRDLMTYKGVLSKLSAAKELQQEYTARERKKTAEREAAKAAAAAAPSDKVEVPATETV